MSTRLKPHELPPGYPKEYQREEVLRDGRRVFIRPILPSDAPELAEAIRSADPETSRGRFLGGPPRVTASMLAHLTEVDYVRRFALVAIDAASKRGVAVARYEPAGVGVAEIAVTVRPDWRRAGLGALLITLLAQAAAERGVHTFSACYLAENRPVTALVEDAGGLSRQVIKQGIAEVSLALDHRQPTGDPHGNATSEARLADSTQGRAYAHARTKVLRPGRWPSRPRWRRSMRLNWDTCDRWRRLSWPRRLSGGTSALFPDLFDWFDKPWPAWLRFTSGRPFRVEDCVRDGAYVLRAELPGIDPDKDVEITVEGTTLAIRAERREEHTEPHRCKFRYGSLVRSVTLPAGADTEHITASYNKGISRSPSWCPKPRHRAGDGSRSRTADLRRALREARAVMGQE